MALVGGIVAGAAASYAGASVIVAVGVGLAAAAAYDYAMDSLMENTSVDTMSGRNVTTKEQTKEREVVYGQVRKGGTVLWTDVTGTNNKYLYQLTAIAHGECESIEKVYFNDEVVWDDGDYQGEWAGAGALGSDVKIVVKTGTSSQAPVNPNADGAELSISYWINTTVDGNLYQHALNDIAYVWTRFDHNPEKYPNGIPDVSVIIKGRKVYDPRIPEHSETNPSTWEYSSNPVLCLFDYLRNEDFGAGIPASEFDESQIEDAADYCDQSIGSPSRTRYVCDGVVNTGQSVRNNIKNILSCMNGRITYAGGKLRIEPYQYSTPHDLTLDEDIIIGDFSIVAKNPRQDNYNVVKGTFVSEHIDYIKTEYPKQTSSNDDYVTADVGEHVLNLDLPFTTNTIRAQRLAKLVLLRSRMQSRLRARLSAKALDYRVGDNINVSNAAFGIENQVYEIQTCSIGFDGENGVYVDIEARENSQDIYDHTASTDLDFSAGQVIELPVIPAVAPPDADSFSGEFGTALDVFGKLCFALRVYWDPPEGVNVQHYIIENYYGQVQKSRQIVTEPVATIVGPRYNENHNGHFSLRVRTVNTEGRTSNYVQKIMSAGYGVIVPIAQGEHLTYTGDADTPPTNAEWIDALGRTPIEGDVATILERDENGLVVDAETYIYQPTYTTGINALHEIPDVTFGDTEDFEVSYVAIMSDTITDAYDVTYSLHSKSYMGSSDGTDADDFDITVSTDTSYAGGKEVGIITHRVTASHYNSATLSKTYLFQKCRVTVRASYGTFTTDIIVDTYAVVR